MLAQAGPQAEADAALTGDNAPKLGQPEDFAVVLASARGHRATAGADVLVPEEADAWYLLGEARLRSKEVLHPAEASLRTLELDARTPLPEWLPPVGRLQRRVLQALQRVEIPAIRKAIEEERPIAVLIQERPAPELVAEGTAPRLPALALGTRLDPQDTALTLTGVAIYVANIARVCRDATPFEEELKFSLDEELAVFFAELSPPEPVADEEPAEEKKPRRRRRRKT